MCYSTSVLQTTARCCATCEGKAKSQTKTETKTTEEKPGATAHLAGHPPNDAASGTAPPNPRVVTKPMFDTTSHGPNATPSAHRTHA